MPTVAETLAEAVGYHQGGQLARAEPLYTSILDADPGHAEAWHFFGLLTYQTGRGDLAIEHIERAIALGADHAAVHLNLGRILAARGRQAEAVERFRHVLHLHPDCVDALLELGPLLRRENRLAEAEACYRALTRLKPREPRGHQDLGLILMTLGRWDEADECFRAVLRLNPDDADAHNQHGILFRNRQRPGEAEACFRQALRARPGHTSALYNLGLVLQEQGRAADAQAAFEQLVRQMPNFAPAHRALAAVFEGQDRPAEAEAAYREAIRLDPADAAAHHGLGNVLKDEGRGPEAKACYDRALSLAPHAGPAIKSALLLPTVMESVEEIRSCRDRLQRNLDDLDRQNLILTEPHREVGAAVFFHLAYHGLNDRALASRLAAFYARACPSLTYVAPHCRPGAARGPGEPPRVGFVSAFLHTHSVQRYYGGLIRRLTRPDFEVSVFPVAPAAEAEAALAALREYGDVWPLDPGQSLAALRERIAERRLDVLVYPEVGMHPVAYFLAFARLAPVQCVMAGHPVTTGIPTLDYFLSSQPAEPADATHHYTERLAARPHLLAHFERPRLSPPPLARREFDLAADRPLYLCVQHLFKIHPDFDGLAAAILRADPRGQLAFVGGYRDHWTALLRERLTRALGADMARVRVLPRQPYDRYLHLLALADVVLDTPHFNGGVTTLQALGLGVPVVTLPGAFLRGRQTLGCYRAMGFPDLVAEDAADYARLAVRLATDPAWREQVRGQILSRGEVLFENDAAVRDLEHFFRAAVGGREVRVRSGG